MKMTATVELDISSEERKRIAIEYLESFLPYDHKLIKVEDNYHWFELFRGHDRIIFGSKEKRAATSFEVNLYKTLEELKK